MICEDLKGRRVLVTGANSGIGSVAAILSSEQNRYIGVHYFRTPGGRRKPLSR
jgi:NAD(P)-dependent dehydrogenase (short-subunit alcohol dehydrogenase family)